MTEPSIPLAVLPERVSPGRAYFQCRNRIRRTRQEGGKGKGKQRADDFSGGANTCAIPPELIYAGIENSPLLRKLQQNKRRGRTTRPGLNSNEVHTLLHYEELGHPHSNRPDVTEELAWSGSTLIWSKGSSIYRKYTFSENPDDKQSIAQALFAYFEVPAPPKAQEQDSASSPASTSSSPPPLTNGSASPTSIDDDDDLYGPFHPRTPPPVWSDDNATASASQEAASTLTSVRKVRVLTVLLEEELRLYYPSGQLHIIPLPFEVKTIWAMERGLLLERQSEARTSLPNWFEDPPFASTSSQTMSDAVFYSMLDPFDAMKPVGKVSGLLNIPAAEPREPIQARQQTEVAPASSPSLYCDEDDQVVLVSDRRDSSEPIMVTLNAKTSRLSIWAYANIVRGPEAEVSAFKERMREEEKEEAQLNGLAGERSVDRGGTSFAALHGTLGKRRRSTDAQARPQSSELDILGLAGEGDQSQRPRGSTATSRRISALLDRRKSQHNPDATVSELLGSLAPAGNPSSAYTNGQSQDKARRRTSLLTTATSAVMDRRTSTTRNELSVSLDRMALGAPGAPSNSQQSQAPMLPSQAGVAAATVDPGQLASHEKQERFEALVGNGDMEREVSMIGSLHFDHEARSDIYMSRLHSVELNGTSSISEVEATMFDITADACTLAVLVSKQQSLALFKISTQSASTGSWLVCQPLRQYGAVSMASTRCSRGNRRDLVLLDSSRQLSVLRDDDQRIHLQAAAMGENPCHLQTASQYSVQVVCRQTDGVERSITASTRLLTGFNFVDSTIQLLHDVLGVNFDPILIQFWQLYQESGERTPEQALNILGQAIIGSKSCDEDNSDNADTLSDWEWVQLRPTRGHTNERTAPTLPGLPDEYVGLCLYTLHLLSEERKLFVATESDVKLLATLVFDIARRISAADYMDIALRDGADRDIGLVQRANLFNESSMHPLPTPFSVHANLLHRLGTSDKPREPIQTLHTVWGQVRGLEASIAEPPTTILQSLQNVIGLYDLFAAELSGAAPSNNLDSLVLAWADKGLTQDDLSALAPALSLPLREAVRQCQSYAPPTWPRRAFALLDRVDQMATLTGPATGKRREPINLKKRFQYTNDAACDTAKNMKPISHVQHLPKRKVTDKATRFSLDHRLDVVQRMLNYTAPKVVKLPKGGTQLTEAELHKAQQEYLVVLARRTLALPVAHAMFQYRVTARLRSAGMSIPKVELAAKVLPSASFMAPTAEAIAPEEKTWPYFHSGVATALHVAWTKDDFDASEYTFHRPAELNARHGGFLLGLGLSGQIRSLGTYQAFKYMDPKHEYTSIGLLLGLGAAYLGTADVKVSSALSVHTAALHPPTAAPLNVALSIQAAGLFGIGLLHVGSCNRRIADNILRDLSKTHISGVEHPDGCLEAYAVSSGFAYGLVMLGRGDQYGGPSDANFLGTFKYLLEGGRGTHLPGAKKNVEGILNAAITSPAATIALGLTFMRTERRDVAELLEIPQSLDRLDHVRNDIILLRTTCRHLIMWNNLSCAKASIEALVPKFITTSLKTHGVSTASVPNDQEVVYWHIISGGCLAMGLKFAGSAKVEAHSVLVEWLDKLVRKVSSITVTASLRSKLAYQSLQNCVNVICLALSAVMAGTGELNVLRRLRVMHGQVKDGISYGSHMARHMALGLLFLGRGRYTLGTSKIATAALFCAFYPVFPPKASSNRFHLQALRHMWALAVEPRCLVAKDVESGKPVYLRLKFKLREARNGQGRETITSKYLTAPTLTPALSTIISIETDSPRYWPVALSFRLVKNHMLSFIKNQTIFVKKKSGHLSYAQDPRGIRSLYTQPESEAATAVFDKGQTAQLLLANRSNKPLNLLASFLSHSSIARANLMAFCAAEDDDLAATRLSTAFTISIVMESFTQDKPEAITMYRALLQAWGPGEGKPVKQPEALLFVRNFYQDSIYGQIFKNRRQTLLRREFVENVYATADEAADEIMRKESVFAALACHLGPIRQDDSEGDQADSQVSHQGFQYLQSLLQLPSPSILRSVLDKATQLASSGEVPPPVLETVLPIFLKRLLDSMSGERMASSQSDHKLARLLASVTIS